MYLTAQQRRMAADLHRELKSQRLSVGLVPAPSQRHATHLIRLAVEENPGWYRRFCGRHASRRRDRRRHFQTAIKRRETLMGLTALAAGRRSCYAERLIYVIDQELAAEAEQFEQERARYACLA